jgi:leader peptidase (prepilin peptidase)/N-methyltransferase
MMGLIGKKLESVSIRTSLRPVRSTGGILGLVGAVAVYVSVICAPGVSGVLGAGLAIVMLAIAVIDWRSFIIPDWLSAAGTCLAIVYAAIQEPDAMLQSVATAVLRGAMLALLFFALRYGYVRLRGRQGLGLGDVKLAFVAGAWLDWLMVPIAIQFAALAALSTYLLRQLISGQSVSATTRMPFGLFFAPAIWICWVVEVRWLSF